ncbi:hypothetical protein, partial [Streptomyces seoulensis]|uniref:hypothetical protein n=1 Tax=Streptomyces seoulensis TaxID=73044 RepID=UPI0033BAACB5
MTDPPDVHACACVCHLGQPHGAGPYSSCSLSASGVLTYSYDGLGREATRTLADGAVYTQGYD